MNSNRPPATQLLPDVTKCLIMAANVDSTDAREVHSTDAPAVGPLQPPNVIVVLTDDQGRWAVPSRMPELVMPHLAELAAESLELEEFYCASPVCSPARASLLTGRMPSAHGVHDWLVGGRHPESRPDHFLEGQPTTPEVFADAGYQCAMSGKWHVGDAREKAPGFEFWYAHRFGGGPYFDAPIWNDGEAATEPEYFTHAVTNNALTFLSQRDRTRPFYLQVNYTAPHDPWINNHPEKYLAHYEGCDFPSVPREARHPWTEPRRKDFEAAFADPQPHIAGYCASLTAVDEGLGLLRAAVRDQGAENDTIVVYLSDNGFSTGHHGIWGKGNGTWPLNFWDNSVRVPFYIHVPDGGRGTSSSLVSGASLHATLCELAGITPPEDRWGVARSVAALARGEEQASDDTVVVTSEYGGARMITDGRWKYVHRHAGPDELYDRQDDPGERTNLVNDAGHRAEKDELATALHDWFIAHQRDGVSGFARPVTGHGQINMTSRGLPPEQTYVQPDLPPTTGA